MTAAQLIDLIAEAMRLKAGWSEANRAALRRWVAGAPPRQDIKERLARLVADGALRPAALPHVAEPRRKQLVEATASGLLNAGERLERQSPDVWFDGLLATAAVVLKYLGIEALAMSHGGAAAHAPDWVFSGLVAGKPRHLVADRVAEVVKRVADDDEDGRLRKNAAALVRGASPHRDTIDEFQVIMTSDASARGRDPPRLAVSLMLQTLMEHLHIGLIERIMFLSTVEAIRNRIADVDDELFLLALQGGVFEAVDRLWSDSPPSDGERST